MRSYFSSSDNEAKNDNCPDYEPVSSVPADLK